MTHKFIVSNGDKSIDIYNDRYIMMGDTQGVSIEANVNVAEYGSQAGGFYNGCHEPARVISVTAKFKRVGDMSAQKKRIYGIFRTGCELDIRYVTPSFDVVTKGYCRKCDIPPNAYPLVMQAEIICPDPYFRKAFVEPIQLFGMSKLFYFTKEGITLNRVCFGNSGRAKVIHLDYGGDISTGVVIRVALEEACGGFRIDNYTSGAYISLTGEFLAGDVIEISTEDGRPYINMVRNGETVKALKYLDEGSEFWKLSPGNNDIKFTSGSLSVSAANVVMYYDVKVGGV